jgi:Tfp pilus tip-associated adhesin PilY1
MLGFKLSYRFKRLQVRWRQWKNSIGDTMSFDETKVITPFQEKAIRLWKLVLKDSNSKLAFNTYGIRQIEKDNLLIVFQHNTTGESVLTIMDTKDNNNNLYELHIPLKQSMYVCDLFDGEMDKRMNNVESKKRSIIETDLDNLIKEEEKNIKKNN